MRINTLRVTIPVLVLSSLPYSHAESSRSAQEAVQDANRLLAEGSYLDAARAYTEAIDLEPSSYVNYYKRATAYLSMGRHNSALEDFDSVLRLNPALVQAHLQKGKVLAREGEFDKAEEELVKFKKTKSDEEADELLEAIKRASMESQSAHQLARAHQWDACITHSTRALEVASNSMDIRRLREQCALKIGDVDSVYGDLSRLSTLDPSSASLSLRLAHISYFLLNSPSSLNHIKQCLHYDPDSKSCKKMHKLLRSFEKDTSKTRNFVEGGTWRSAIKILDGENNDGLLSRFESALDDAMMIGKDGENPYLPPQFEPKKKSQARLELYSLACKAAVGVSDFRKNKGMLWCEETLAMDPENVDALVGKGEKLLKDEAWEDAVRFLEQAFQNSGRSSQDILNRLQKAQRLLKVSKQKDYYKVLGVSRDADDRTIKRAFRKMSKTAHPDVGGSEAQMAALNEAYEVLSDPELRQRYDNGDDPNDPTAGQRQNPFAHHGGVPFQFFQQGGGGGGFPFGGGGGGGGQKFHFQFGG